MDEIKAIQKSVSELKTIQNRLNKFLKEKQSTESQEVAELNDMISLLNARLDTADLELTLRDRRIDDLESQNKYYEKIIATLKYQRSFLIKEIKENKKRKSVHVYEITGVDVKKNGLPEIDLHGGCVKFWKKGKCGIKDTKGRIIVDCKYNEIGSFQSNFIGFIYGSAEIVKGLPPYRYRIPIAARFKYSNIEGAVFDVGGVDCCMSSPQDNKYIAGEYYYMIIDKITKNFQEIELASVTTKNTVLPDQLRKRI